MQIATDVGFAPPVLVKSSIITCEDPELKKMAGRQCSSSSLSLSLLCPLLFFSLFHVLLLPFLLSLTPLPPSITLSLLLLLPFLFLLLFFALALP